MKNYNFSAKLRKALNTETKNIDIFNVITRKGISTRWDVMRLTGIPRIAFDFIFDDDMDKVCRALRFDISATSVLSIHIQREDITPCQRAVSELLWKRMKEVAIDMFSQQYRHITGRFLEDDFWDEEVFQEETYVISDEEMEEVAQMVKKHVAEVSENQETVHA